MRKIALILILIISACELKAQELNCTVTVLTPRIQSSDKKIYTTLQTSIFEFMNNTKWTNDKFTNEEKIECSIQIEITDRPSTDVFKGTIQVSVRRPVFGTSYNSPIMNYKDDDFNFRYIEYQALEYNESGNNPNLVAMLAFYANMILGFDYDSYSLLGGSTFFAKAQTLVANNTNSPEKGWRAFEANRNRYWLSENINNPIYKPIRVLFYDYHRKALDIMAKKNDEAIRQIATSIESLKKVHVDKPGSVIMKTLFDAKSDEVVNIFTPAPADVKSRMTQVLSEIDPSNASKYLKIQSGGN
ncbi:DUF4835 family protein [soil metagenome]